MSEPPLGWRDFLAVFGSTILVAVSALGLPLWWPGSLVGAVALAALARWYNRVADRLSSEELDG